MCHGITAKLFVAKSDVVCGSLSSPKHNDEREEEESRKESERVSFLDTPVGYGVRVEVQHTPSRQYLDVITIFDVILSIC